jgi:hypothetical protein
MKVVAGIAVVAFAAWLWTNHERAATEHKLATVASELAGRPVGVQCQGFCGAMLDIQSRAGEVRFPNGRAPDHMFLTRGVCGRLDAFLSARSHHDLDCLAGIDWIHWSVDADFDAPCERRARGDAEAVNTLAHESMHLRGFVDEAQTQCYAIQVDAWTVVRLGGTQTEGYAVAQFILALQPTLASEYQSGDCRAGGRLDLCPQTAAFPSEDPPVLPPAAFVGPAAAGL